MSYLIYFFAQYLIFLTPFILLYYIYKNRNKHQFKSNFFLDFKKMILVGFAGIFSWAISSLFIKNIFKFDRPITSGDIITPIDQYSFPSGHTTFIVALGTALYTYDKKLGIFTILLGTLIGISRVLTGVHYYIDIIGGVFFGIVFGLIFINIIKRIIKIKNHI